jgi:hypothetical protein
MDCVCVCHHHPQQVYCRVQQRQGWWESSVYNAMWLVRNTRGNLNMDRIAPCHFPVPSSWICARGGKVSICSYWTSVASLSSLFFSRIKPYSSCLLCSKCSCVAHVCHTHIVAPNVTRKMKESRTSRSLQLNIVCHGYE